jgi:hypothetical protein
MSHHFSEWSNVNQSRTMWFHVLWVKTALFFFAQMALVSRRASLKANCKQNHLHFCYLMRGNHTAPALYSSLR